METEGEIEGGRPGWEYIWIGKTELLPYLDSGWSVVSKHEGFLYTKYLMERKRDETN